MIKVLAVEFKEAVEMPLSSRPVEMRITEDVGHASRYDVTYHAREQVIVISPRDGVRPPKVIPVSHTKGFEVDPEDLKRLMLDRSQPKGK